jgi:nudix motif 8
MTAMVPARFDEAALRMVEQRLQALPRRRITREAPRAAVLVPLCHVDGVPAVLFTKRTESVGTHKGHVSFPGGRVEADDVDDVHTALREAEEEIGLRPDRVRVLGVFHEAVAITHTIVTPVIGFIDGDLDTGTLALSPDEIEMAFALTLEQLTDPAHRRPQQLGPRVAPIFSAGPHPVWGLTAWIMDEVLREALGLPLTSLTDEIVHDLHANRLERSEP